MSKPGSLSSVTVVILAGGFGTRIKHMLPNIPKPLAMVSGKPFLEWQIRFLYKLGFRNIVISTGYLGEQIKHFAGRLKLRGLMIECINEEKPLGTAGGFFNAIKNSQFLNEDILVLNGDSLLLGDIHKALNFFKSEKMEVGILAVSMLDCSRYGSLSIDQSSCLINFGEKISGQGLINAGVYFFKKNIAKFFDSNKKISFEYDVFPELIAQKNKIGVYVSNFDFIDIGTEQTLNIAHEFIEKNANYFA
jgi:D-glycero-alpha-D-manno-heptose 1-phosphate guanylyltransferase